MPGIATVVTAVQVETISPTLLSYGKVLPLVAVFERMIAVGMDPAPWEFIPFGGRCSLDLLGERPGNKDVLLGSRGTLLVLGGGSLFLGFVFPGELGSFFCSSTSVCKLPKLGGWLNLVVA